VIRERILIDAGPIVAILATADAAHRDCVAASREYAPPFFTSWAVLAEVAWLLKSASGGIPSLMRLLSGGLIVPLELDAAAPTAIAELAVKYADLHPDLADLTLVYLAEREGIETVFTLDRRDFTVYRSPRRQSFRLIPQCN
jgi:predicted nucleic acid-binding protein